MDNDLIPGIVLLSLGVIAFILLVAAEAGVIAGVRERAMREPAESRVESLRRFYQERQLTLSTLAFARNLTLVGVSAVLVFLIVREWEEGWIALAVTIFITAAAFMLLQAIARFLVSRNPERWRRTLKPFVAAVRAIFRIPVLLVDAPLAAVTRTWQKKADQPMGGAEELILVTELEEAGAALQADEREMIRGVMELEFTTVREVMVPRTDFVAVDVHESFEHLAQVMVDTGLSRVPLFENNIDKIVGIAYGKQVMKQLAKGSSPADLREIARPALFVPESKRVHEMLAEMRAKQLSIAIVVDEYGGTAGLVTLEDLIEEIVGEIRDEFDREEQEVQPLTTDDVIVDARVDIDEINDLFNTAIQKQDFDSVGGFIIHELGRMPSVGDTVRVNGINLKVLSVAGRRVKKVRVTKAVEEENGQTAVSK